MAAVRRQLSEPSWSTNMTQTNLTRFQNRTENTDESTESEGPSPPHPIPDVERADLPGGIDSRALPQTGLAPSDFELIGGVCDPAAAVERGYHPADRLESWEAGPGLFASNAHERIHQLVGDDLARVREIEDNIADRDEDDDRASGTAHAVATDGGTTTESAASEKLPANETVRLITGITGLRHSPSVVEGEASNSGKTIAVEHADQTFRLDTETILAGESEFRSSRYFELYTPGRLRHAQRINKAHGPEAGAKRVSDVDDLPEPTQWPRTEQPTDTPDECPTCGEGTPHWKDEGRPRWEHCGELVPTPESEKSDRRKQYEADKERIDTIERTDVLLLDGQAGEFLVTKKRRDVAGTLRGFELVDREGTEYRLNVVLSGDVLFDLERSDEPVKAVKNVKSIKDIQDFDIVRSDQDWLRSWIRSQYDDSDTSDYRIGD